MTKITIDRSVVQQALEALERYGGVDQRACDAEEALRAALAQEQAEPVQEPQTLDEALRLPRAMAQAYERGYKAGVAAKDAEDSIEGIAQRISAAIRARGNT